MGEYQVTNIMLQRKFHETLSSLYHDLHNAELSEEQKLEAIHLDVHFLAETWEGISPDRAVFSVRT